MDCVFFLIVYEEQGVVSHRTSTVLLECVLYFIIGIVSFCTDFTISGVHIVCYMLFCNVQLYNIVVYLL